MTLFKLSRIQSSGCLSVSCAVKTFSYAVAGGVRWSSSSTDKNKSIFDIEQEMFQHKRLMSTAYSQGSFRVALEHAQELKRKALEIMGIRTTVYASSLNNVALMVLYPSIALPFSMELIDRYHCISTRCLVSKTRHWKPTRRH